MRRALTLLFALTLAGCPYMTEEQYDSYWDNDQDTYGVDEDCDDTNPLKHPFAHDFRGDGCDADCGGEADADDDDWPDDQDCGIDDPTRYPCAPEVEGDGIDSDCDGFDTVRAGGCDAIDPDADEAGEPTPQLTADCQFVQDVGGGGGDTGAQ